MVRRVVATVAVLMAAGVTAHGFFPGWRVRIDRRVSQVAGWTEEARRADPAGFAQYARGKLERDLEAMQRTRRALAGEIGQLARKVREKETLHDQARGLAEEFRAKYRQAVTNGQFPIEVRGAAYNHDQVKSQVSMILAETGSHETARGRLDRVKRQAETQLEALTARISACESQRTALAVQQEMLRAQQLTAECEMLLAQVDQLLDENSQVLQENPVRTVRELLDTLEGPSDKAANDEAVEAFLNQEPDGAEQPVGVQQRSETAGQDDSFTNDAALPATEKPRAGYENGNDQRDVKADASRQATGHTSSGQSAEEFWVDWIRGLASHRSARTGATQKAGDQQTSESIQQQSPVQSGKPIFQQF